MMKNGGKENGGKERSLYVAKPVSPYFRTDWNYAIRIAKLPLLRPASLVITAMPLLIDVQTQAKLPIKIENFWLLWWASLLFLIGIGVLRWRAPAFIQEYQYYSQFLAKDHSHRWIVWEFYLNLKSVPDVGTVIRETVEKKLSFATATVDDNACRACPTFPSPLGNTVEVYKPENINRDIYLPLRIEGERYVLPMQETDPELPQKQRELFWILLGKLGSGRTPSRFLVWALFGIAGFLFVLTILNNVIRVATEKSFFQLIQTWLGCL